MKNIDGPCIIVPLLAPITEDESISIEMLYELSEAIRHTSNYDWHHAWLDPKYIFMFMFMHEGEHYASANHLHMTRGLKPSRLEYWVDIANIRSGAPWAACSTFIDGVDRLLPVIHLLNGGETAAKNLLRK